MINVPFKISESIQDYNLETRQRVVALLGMLEPHHSVGSKKTRVGRMNDGGYIMIDDFASVAAAYSLGISDDVSWDLDVARRGIEVFQYDHTIAQLPETHLRFNWKSLGVAAEKEADGSVSTLPAILQENGHEHTRDLVLKCDIEGHEWSVFATLDQAIVRQFRQIVLEIHAVQELCHPEFCETARRAISNLTANHRVVHVHANNYGPWAILGGIPLPTVLELTLLRCDRGSLEPSHERFPTKLDMPNNPLAGDFPLGDFRFHL